MLLEFGADIDECVDNTTYECGKNSYCANTEGSYSCLCANGYVGDARKDGIDCFPLPTSKSNKMTILIGKIIMHICMFFLTKKNSMMKSYSTLTRL